MKLVRWNRPYSYWPSVFDEDFFDWPSISEDKGLNIYETDDEVVVEAAVPGVPEEEVNVTVEGNVLSISAEHEETEEEKDKKKTVYKSTRQASFSYSTSLPRVVDGSKARAEVEDGVVKVYVPKTEETKPKKIEVTKKIK